jgi:hypothetical protein
MKDLERETEPDGRLSALEVTEEADADASKPGGGDLIGLRALAGRAHRFPQVVGGLHLEDRGWTRAWHRITPDREATTMFLGVYPIGKNQSFS